MLRQHHNCHGLRLAVAANPKPTDTLSDAANKLLAKVQTDETGQPKGTFEVWRRSAREYPIGGYHVTELGSVSHKGYRLLLRSFDDPPPILDKQGLSLAACFANLPYMRDVLNQLGAEFDMVRATFSSKQTGATGHSTLTMILHPTSIPMLDKFGSLVKVHAGAVNYLDINEFAGGYMVSETLRPDYPGVLIWPHATCLTDEDVFFSCSKHNLGEFGYIYAALHICGNFARYFPDLWLKHIEVSSPLAMAIDELCSHATERIPLLCLSELQRTYHVIEK
jgi:hypothetical protein